VADIEKEGIELRLTVGWFAAVQAAAASGPKHRVKVTHRATDQASTVKNRRGSASA
jgi:hypothetical protein